eukprot:Rmarinus@m.13760
MFAKGCLTSEEAVLISPKLVNSTGFVLLGNPEHSTSVSLRSILSASNIEVGDKSSRPIVLNFLNSSKRIKEQWKSMLCIIDFYRIVESLKPFTDRTSAISKSSHPIVASAHSRIDIMYGILLEKGLYPALLIEITSEYENNP